ncbi:MAG: hypothetical protein K9M54_06480 [Kiritimatiellales bacterium]|nr:hypothetical protein [Kiritimatiellales bacterium]MCF7864766.1 hypothetical protein [Kiritimatiellales bacterium]
MKTSLKFILSGLLVCASLAQATIIQQIGNYGGWGSVQWQPLGGLNDGIDAGVSTGVDFVGNSTNPGAYWSIDDSYVYFRMRLNIDAVPLTSTLHDSHFVLIDVAGYNNENGNPDFGFVFDSSSQDNAKHGLEMSVFGSNQPGNWGGIRMTDLDGSFGSKGVDDINGGGRTTDGYVQTTDGQLTDAFGLTTFLDFAVSLSYLSNYVPVLVNNSSWKIQLGAIQNANDHNQLAEVGGGVLVSDIVSTSSWTVTTNISEPTVVAFIGISACGMLVARRLFQS